MEWPSSHKMRTKVMKTEISGGVGTCAGPSPEGPTQGPTAAESLGFSVAFLGELLGVPGG